MKQLRKILDRILEFLAGISFLAMVVLTCWQVFTRYILKSPSSWSEELVSYLFAWMALLGASLVVGERGHMNIPVVVERMSPGLQKFFSIFAEIIACIFAAVILVFGGVQITSLAMGQMTSSLGVAVGVFYVVLPLSGVLNIIYTILNICDILSGRISVLPSEEAPASKNGKEA
ncbi:MAG TPA: TRAP transporter small permease [Candidatus Cottocaccamicrobium excrementipullorum]|nr:TRAP transporter small permease [Candidatus Cottocaccamicrobium excrementipullorum]